MGKLLLNVGLWPLILLFALTGCSGSDVNVEYFGSKSDRGAVLVNLPAQVNNKYEFYPSVSPVNDIHWYQYKYGLQDSTDCSDSAGYSSDIPQTTSLYVYVSAYDLYRLCVVGENSKGEVQPYEDATVFEWEYVL